MKFSLKRVLSFALVMLMVISLLPTTTSFDANAAGTLSTITGLTASYGNISNSKGSASWSASGTSITGTTTGYKGTILSYTVNSTLTLTNNSGGEATLSFNYTLTNGGSVSGAISGTSGGYSSTLADGASISIKLTSPKGASTNTLSITGLSLISTSAGNVTTTFKPATVGGSYTVAVGTATAESVSAALEKTNAAGTEYTVVATAASGYQFFGWYDETNGVYLDYNATYAFKPAANMTVVPKFVSTTTALFGVGAARFDNLTEAGAFAAAGSNKTIILLNNGTVAGTHTIPAGVTLLVPFDSSNTLYTTEPAHTNNNLLDTASWVQPTAYRTLTLAADANITVNGSISVSGKHFAGGGNPTAGGCGVPTGPVGFVQMVSGSQITLNSGANLYAWGYVTGGGTITAKSGSKVYENFQIRDFRGGGATTTVANDGIVFPLSQYYVQNIEVPTDYEYGAEEHVYTSLYISGASYSAGVKFIGDGAMFQTQEGAVLTKDYIENKDRLELTVNGNAALANMSLSLAGTDIDSSTFILPINSNITININSGTTTLKQDLALLPGVEMNIAQGAVLDLASGTGSGTIESGTGYNLFVYDLDEWNYGYSVDTFDPDDVAGSEKTTGVKYVHQSYQWIALKYAPGRTYTRTASDLKDVKIDVNGTIVTNGFLYTTLGGASIISSGETGVIAMNNGAGDEMFTYQAGQNDTTPVYYVIPVTSAQLQNGDGSYVSTADATAGTTYNYCANHNCWYTGECDKCKSVSITWIGANGANLGTEDYDNGTIPSYKGSTPTKVANGCTTYTFAGWVDKDGNKYPVGTALPAATADAVYTAYFTEGTSHTNVVNDAAVEPGCESTGLTAGSHCEACGTVIVAQTTVPAAGHADSDRNHVCDNGCSVYQGKHEDSPTDKDHICDYCKSDEVLESCSDVAGDKDHNCDVCFAPNVTKCSGGTAYCNAKAICSECSQSYGEQDADIHASEKFTYVINKDGTHTKKHACCLVEVETVKHNYENGECVCTAVQTFTVIWVNENGETEESETVAYGGSATKNPDVPAKDGYNGAWSSTATNVTSDVTITPEYTIKSYLISFDTNGDGEVDYSASFNHFSKLAMAAPVLPENNAQYTYTFDCWKDQNGNVVNTDTVVTGEMTVTMYYTTTVNTYKGTITETGSNGGNPYLTNTTVTYGVAYTTRVLMGQGVNAWNTDVVRVTVGGVELTKGTDYTYDLQTVTLTINAEKVTGEIVIYAQVNAAVTFDLNGGDLAADVKAALAAGGLTVTDGKITMPLAYGVPSSFGTTVEALNATFVREGYKCTGLKNGNQDADLTAPVVNCTLTVQWACTHATTKAVDNGDGTHDVICQNAECKAVVEDNATHDYDETTHICACEDVEKFTLYIYSVKFAGDEDYWSSLVEVKVPYGKLLKDYIPETDDDGDPILLVGESKIVSGSRYEGTFTITGWSNVMDGSEIDMDTMTMPADDLEIRNDFSFTGWEHQYYDHELNDWSDTRLGTYYSYGDYVYATGWTEIDGNWYYFDEETNFRAEGISRVPYNTELGYGPDQETLDYCESKGIEFIDADEAWFVFNEDGKFQATAIGLTADNRWAVNGMLAWHPGLVEIEGEYYYFLGDMVNGGNVMATGDVYAYENTTDLEINTNGGIYTFGADGKLCKYDGITNVDGTLYYYEDYQLMIGKGLIKVEDSFYYVLSNGKLVVSASYWVANVNEYTDIAVGLYEFDANGKMVIPEPDPIKNGIYWETNKGVTGWFYYENGTLGYGKGLINTLVNWYDADGNATWGEGGIVYIRSNGQLATGSYYVTNLDNYDQTIDVKAGDKLIFNDLGLMLNVKDGIVAENGTLYYYENNQIAYNAGVIEIGGNYYYVRSNGEVVNGRTYWITNVGDSGVVVGCYEFDENGVMLNPDFTAENGIIDGYYYVDGHIAYGAGLIQLEDGSYIYVRSNGQLATGEYWTTNHNDELPEGLYDFGENGILVTE